MKTAKLQDMKKGWFIGNFDPTLCATNDVEALEDAVNVVVKIPGANNDKYVVGD